MSKNLSSPAMIGARMNAAYNRRYAWWTIRRSSAVSGPAWLGVLISAVSVLIGNLLSLRRRIDVSVHQTPARSSRRQPNLRRLRTRGPRLWPSLLPSPRRPASQGPRIGTPRYSAPRVSSLPLARTESSASLTGGGSTDPLARPLRGAAGGATVTSAGLSEVDIGWHGWPVDCPGKRRVNVPPVPTEARANTN